MACPSPTPRPADRGSFGGSNGALPGYDDHHDPARQPTVGLHVSGVSTHETIPRPPVRFLALYAHLPADGRWEGRGTPPARLKATPISLADASRVPGPGQGLRISVGDPPRPFDPSVSPSTVRTIRGPQAGWEPLEDLAGRGGRTRGPRLEAIPPLLRAEGSTAGSSGRGFDGMKALRLRTRTFYRVRE
jgi:hypothetical protein